MRKEIKKALKDIEYPEVKEALQIYEKEGRPFALPSFKPQDRSSAKQRTADLLGGFPFTSDAYPWPTGGADGLHMQPIIQVNLEQAGKLLNFEFGNGLLQVWGLVGKDKASFDIVDLAFDSDFSKGVLLRVIPIEETIDKPSDFFPSFSPWLDRSDLGSGPSGHLFIEPSKPMSDGSLISWKISSDFMYPLPLYEMHNVNKLVPDPTEKTEDVDSWDLFDELKAGISALLKTPGDGGDYCIGGVRGYGEGRDADRAQGFPILLNMNGEINLSVIFDESLPAKPRRPVEDSPNSINSAGDNKLRVVYSYNK